MKQFYKRLLIFITVFSLVISALPAWADSPSADQVVMKFRMNVNNYTVNGVSTSMDVGPTEIAERAFLPVAYVTGPLGIETKWDNNAQKVTVLAEGKTMELWIGKNRATINGSTVYIDPSDPGVKPLTINGRTMLPLRFVAENLGCDVVWDAATSGITISKGLVSASDEEDEIKKMKEEIEKMKRDQTKKEEQDKIKEEIRRLEEKAKQAQEEAEQANQKEKQRIAKKEEEDRKKEEEQRKKEQEQENKQDNPSKLPGWMTSHRKGSNTISDEFYKLPVVNNLGKGYDTIGGVYGEANPKKAVLDLDLLQKHHFIEKQWVGNFMEDINIAESLEEYSNNLKVDVKTKGHYLLFSGSVDVHYGKQRENTTHHYFATFSYMNARNDIYIPSLWTSQEGYGRYKAFLLPDAKRDINDRNYPVDRLIDTYGSFVLAGLINGGRADYSIKTEHSAVKGKEDFGAKVKASAEFIIAGGSAETSVDVEKQYKKFKDKTQQTIRITGHKGTLGPEQFRKNTQERREWEQSLTDENSNMVAFSRVADAEPIIPIWELCDDGNRKKAIESEVSRRVNEAKAKLPKNIPISREYVRNIYIGMNSNERKAREEAKGADRTVLSPHVNHHAGGDFCYLGISTTKVPDFAITDILIFATEDGGYDPPYVQTFRHQGILRSNYELAIKPDQQSSNPKGKNYYLKKKGAFNLNNEAGGHILYLYKASRDSSKRPPIYEIMILDTSEHEKGPGQSDADYAKKWAEENDWEPITFDVDDQTPANLNHHAGGHKLFLMVRRDYAVK
ncbi:stalk domain-containing protein [Filifactor villosus]|uniref:Stalk domain-containing protein n=1 Tax=Filifactor villosus TaxID=29374 RepID=A0ABV9QIJ3_9FIRM